MKVILELDRGTPADSLTTTPNRMAYGLVQIVRMPHEGIVATGKNVGDQIEGQVVLKYAGPLTLILDPGDGIVKQQKRRNLSSRTSSKKRHADHVRSDKKRSGRKTKNRS